MAKFMIYDIGDVIRVKLGWNPQTFKKEWIGTVVEVNGRQYKVSNEGYKLSYTFVQPHEVMELIRAYNQND